MKVILRTDVEHLGRGGEVKEVSPGFGRNFLFPRKLAWPATPAALKTWEKGREKCEKLNAERTSQAKQLAEKLGGVSLSFSRSAGPEGRLFGSIGKADIVKSLKACGFTVEKTAVQLEGAIKKAGDYEVEVRLGPDVKAKLKVAVTAQG